MAVERRRRPVTPVRNLEEKRSIIPIAKADSWQEKSKQLYKIISSFKYYLKNTPKTESCLPNQKRHTQQSLDPANSGL